MGRDSLHPGVLDSEFLLKQGDLVAQAVNLGLEPSLTIPTQGRSGEQGREGVVAQSQDVQHGGANAALPATGQGQFGGHRSLRENLLSRASRRA